MVLDYRRSVDFATGIYECRIVWQCRSGATVTTTERRAVGFESRGSLGISLELSADRDVSADVTSSVINRQDQPVEDHSAHDPRRAGRHAGRVLLPVQLDGGDGSLRLSWEAAESKQRVGIAVDHWTSAGHQPFDTLVDQDDSSVRYVLAVGADEPFRLEKSVSYAVAGRYSEGLPGTADAEAGEEPADAAEAGLKTVARSSPKARRTTATTGPPRTSWWAASPSCSRPSAGTSSSWPRPRPAPTLPASPPRASAAPATKGTTSGTRRSTSCRT